jgi:hypothetical protein
LLAETENDDLLFLRLICFNRGRFSAYWGVGAKWNEISIIQSTCKLQCYVIECFSVILHRSNTMGYWKGINSVCAGCYICKGNQNEFVVNIFNKQSRQCWQKIIWWWCFKHLLKQMIMPNWRQTHKKMLKIQTSLRFVKLKWMVSLCVLMIMWSVKAWKVSTNGTKTGRYTNKHTHVKSMWRWTDGDKFNS